MGRTLRRNSKQLRPCECGHAESRHVPLTAKERKDMPRLVSSGLDSKCLECSKLEYIQSGARGTYHKFEFDALKYVCWVADARREGKI
jgi:hypothetical protein